MANDSKKYVSLTRLSDFLDNIKRVYAQIGHKHTMSDVTDYQVDSALSSTSVNPVQNKVLDAEFEAISKALNVFETEIDDKAPSTHTHKVSDISDFPTIPTKTSDLVNDSGFKTTDNNTTYDFSASTNSINGNVNIKLAGSDDTADAITIIGTGGATVTTDSFGLITVDGTSVTLKTWTTSDMV